MFTRKISDFRFQISDPSDSELAKHFRKWILAICILFVQISTNAQCAMCRAALAGESNKVKAEAVNDGIVYLMVIPYLLVGGIGYYIYRMRKKKKQE